MNDLNTSISQAEPFLPARHEVNAKDQSDSMALALNVASRQAEAVDSVAEPIPSLGHVPVPN